MLFSTTHLFDAPNPQAELKVQMTAQVFFVLAQANDALYVPLSALARHQSGRAGPRTVRVSRTMAASRPESPGWNHECRLRSDSFGLNEGDTVVTGTANPRRTITKRAPFTT